MSPDALPTSTSAERGSPEASASTSTSTDTIDAQTRLTNLKAAALKAYLLRDYTLSTDLYAQACELQATLTSDNDPRNAELLYLYGRSIFNVAVGKSDILGGVPDESGKASKPETEKSKKKFVEAGPSSLKEAPKGGIFSFKGDENWDTDSEDEDEDEEPEEDDSDDFTHAWEILDLSRVLYARLLSDEYTPALTPAERNAAQISLSDVYDFLGEVSLESESFQQAAKDFRSSLELKQNLYELHSTLVSEAHYKLSLALEFAAAGEDVAPETATEWLKEAASQLEKAIESCKARIAKEEAQLAKEEESKGKGKAKGKESGIWTESLQEAREMVKELEKRLADLRTAPPKREGALNKDIISGLFGEALGIDPKKIQEVLTEARDVSDLVRRKPQKQENREEKENEMEGEKNGNGKRKLGDVMEEDGEGEGSGEGKGKDHEGEKESKKVRMEEVTDETMI